MISQALVDFTNSLKLTTNSIFAHPFGFFCLFTWRVSLVNQSLSSMISFRIIIFLFISYLFKYLYLVYVCFLPRACIISLPVLFNCSFIYFYSGHNSSKDFLLNIAENLGKWISIPKLYRNLFFQHNPLIKF